MCSYVGTCGHVSVLNLVIGKLAGLFKELQAHKCSYIWTCEPANVVT
jgi:hypothetical protein